MTKKQKKGWLNAMLITSFLALITAGLVLNLTKGGGFKLFAGKWFGSDRANAAGTCACLSSSSCQCQVNASDADGHALVAYELIGAPSGLTISSSGLTSGIVASGAYVMSVRVTDEYGAVSAPFSFTLNVDVPTNLPPAISPISCPGGTVGVLYPGCTVHATDPEGNTPITFAMSGGPAGLAIDPGTGKISGTPTTAGTYTVTVKAVDSLGAFSNSLPFAVVIAAAPNLPPVIGAISCPGGTVGVSYAGCTIPATDPESDPITFTMSGGPAGLSIGGTSGAISGTPAADGTFSVIVNVTDSHGAFSNSIPFTITIAPIPNLPPIIGPISCPSGTSSILYAGCTITATDPESNPITFTMSGGPAGLSIGGASGIISGTPTADGTFNVTVKATDSRGASVSSSFTLIIQLPPNDPPVIGPISCPIGMAGFPYAGCTITATDPEGDPFAFTITGGPAGLSINPSTGLISGTPSVIGTYSMTVYATDARGFGSKTFTLIITDCSSFTYGGQTYSTVAIGSQCWMASNLNVGIRIDSTNTGLEHSDASNDAIVEKYCFGDDIANCNATGGLYDWREAVGYAPTTNQGICPSGWHIPSSGELSLANASPLFPKQKAGYRVMDGRYYGLTITDAYWTSSKVSASTAYYFLDEWITGNIDYMSYGFSIRCIKGAASAI